MSYRHVTITFSTLTDALQTWNETVTCFPFPRTHFGLSQEPENLITYFLIEVRRFLRTSNANSYAKCILDNHSMCFKAEYAGIAFTLYLGEKEVSFLTFTLTKYFEPKRAQDAFDLFSQRLFTSLQHNEQQEKLETFFQTVHTPEWYLESRSVQIYNYTPRTISPGT